jgi:hypothetical protein
MVDQVIRANENQAWYTELLVLYLVCYRAGRSGKETNIHSEKYYANWDLLLSR